MNPNRKTYTTVAGSLYLLGFVAGVLSIANSVDTPEYLSEASLNATSVLVAAFFHSLMALIYVGVGFSLYPDLKKHNQWLALGFSSFRVIAGVFVFIGVILLLLILALSQSYMSVDISDTSLFSVVGHMLQSGRDFVNHVASIISVCFAGLFLNILILRSRLVPRWLAWWGIFGTVSAIGASYLFMFQKIGIITQEYLILNSPMALQEIIFGFWLIIFGFNKVEKA